MNESQVFANALKLATPAEQAAYLDAACAGDPQLRADVEALLAAHASDPAFLEQPAGSLVGTVDGGAAPSSSGEPPARPAGGEQPGVVLAGRYQLLQPIGEGGMGTVWLAEQHQPVRRKVAVKLVKSGMDSKAVLARFEAERQALALMDHPNIAKVLDAGAAPDGRPFFVMELIEGVPITQFCDAHRLTTRQRLELFVPVCAAVQHAHQKGVVHRDLKPSNVLVALCDGRPAPQVIDFGVAKAVGRALTDKTLVTWFGAIVGTLEYMSPEQAEINQLDIDTRSDVYSLGVLLYELLAGSPPFTRKGREQAGVLEMLRVIREQEPTRPSTKLSTAEGLPTLAANRGTEPAKLTKLVRGELDWIVMKALEKDRSHRYESASAFAADVERYLADEPVLACPPSVGYRLRKFARRNKKAMAAVAAFVLLLLAATATSIGLASWALRERHVATANEKEANERADELRTVLDFVENQVFAAARPQGQDGGLGRDVTLRRAVESALAYVEESFPDQPLIEARLRLAIGISFLHLGDGKTAETQFKRARAIWAAELGPDHPNTLAAMSKLGSAYHVQGRYREALELDRKTLELKKARLGRDHPDTLISMSNVAGNLSGLGHRDEATRLHEEVFVLRKNKLGPDHADTIRSMSNLAIVYRAAGRHAEALEFGEEALRRRKAKYGPHHSGTLRSMRILARIYVALGRHADALDLREETLRLHKVKLGPDHPQTVLSMADLAWSYFAHDRHEDALKLREKTLPLMKAKFGAGGYETLNFLNGLAENYEALSRHEEAEKVREEMRQHRKTKHGPGPPPPHPKTGDGK